MFLQLNGMHRLLGYPNGIQDLSIIYKKNRSFDIHLDIIAFILVAIIFDMIL